MILFLVLGPEGETKIAALFADHHELLYRIACRLVGAGPDAEDAVQRAFVKIVAHAENIQKIPCHKLLPYSVIIVKNSCIDLLRKRKRGPTLVGLGEVSGAEAGTEESIFQAEDAARVAALLGRISPEAAQLLRLRYLEDYSYREVSQLLGITEATARKREERALRKLRELYEKEGLE